MAHGTGTSLGDPIEVGGLAGAFGAAPFVLGAAKANIGHLEDCAGLVGVIKAVMVLQTRRVAGAVLWLRVIVERPKSSRMRV